MRHLAPAELDDHLHLARREEARGVVELGLQVVLADVAGELQFLELGRLLVFADFLLPLLTFKAVSAEIHDFADVFGSAAESGAFLLVGAAAV